MELLHEEERIVQSVEATPSGWSANNLHAAKTDSIVEPASRGVSHRAYSAATGYRIGLSNTRARSEINLCTSGEGKNAVFRDRNE